MSAPGGLAALVARTGGELSAGGRRASIPGPGHSPADRSVSLLLVGRRVVIHGFAGQDWRELRDWLRTLGLVDAAGRLVGAGAATSGPHPPSRRERLAAAVTLWAGSRPLAGTLAERHLRARGVRRPAGSELRFHPGVAAAVYETRGPRRPALLAAVRDASGALCAVEIVYLGPGGEAARVRLPRKTVGLVPRGAAVRIDPPGPELLVGEGVVTCLSASARFRLPAHAALSAGRLAAWSPPKGVRRVLVAADAGRAGQLAAEALAARLRRGGWTVRLETPPPPFGDWNEARAWRGGGRTGAGGPEPADGPRPAREPDP